jgi:hypothetical protein
MLNIQRKTGKITSEAMQCDIVVPLVLTKEIFICRKMNITAKDYAE